MLKWCYLKLYCGPLWCTFRSPITKICFQLQVCLSRNDTYTSTFTLLNGLKLHDPYNNGSVHTIIFTAKLWFILISTTIKMCQHTGWHRRCKSHEWIMFFLFEQRIFCTDPLLLFRMVCNHFCDYIIFFYIYIYMYFTCIFLHWSSLWPQMQQSKTCLIAYICVWGVLNGQFVFLFHNKRCYIILTVRIKGCIVQNTVILFQIVIIT